MKSTAKLLLLGVLCTGTLAQNIRVDARLVEVYASVFDQKGSPVDGLPRDRFQVLDEGIPQKLFSFEPDSVDLTCAILLDTTGSMQDALPAVKNSVSRLLDELRPDDSVGVFTFDTKLEQRQAFTTDKAAARTAVLRTRAGGETALFDAMAGISDVLAKRAGKKVVVLFTDGSDNASSLRAHAAIGKVVKAGVPIYAVAEGEALRSAVLRNELHEIAGKTGGKSYQARSRKDIARIFEDIQNELKHLYLLSYQPPPGDPAKWRAIQVLVAGSNYKVAAKPGYFPN